ncbi:MAG: alpha-amylase [Bacteroidales bacterium]|nr:alpha-amylase [Bacteroidales bacterium]
MNKLKSPLLLIAIILAVMACQTQPKNTAQSASTDTISLAPVAEWLQDAVIYEVNVRQYTAEGTFDAFAQHLPRLQELGIDILWLMPIYPIGEKNRKGSLGSYYSIRDYKAVNPEFGTMEDFQAVVSQAHELGMTVILDWVANHTAWDHQWITDHPEWYEKDSTGQMFGPFDWSDVAQLDYDNQDMRAAMKDALEFWVREANIDGYRCDVAGMVPVDFWEDATAALQTIKPVFMLAEDESETALLHKAFNANYGWAFHHHLNKIAQGEENATHAVAYFENLYNTNPFGAWPMQFTTNHDENSWNGTVYERMGDAYPTMAALTFMVEGMPLIYTGQEAGIDKMLAFFEKDEVDWSDLTMTGFYQSLIQLKKTNKALWNGAAGAPMEFIATNEPEKVLLFKRRKDNNTVVALFNLSNESVTVTAETGLEGEFKDSFTDETILFPLTELELKAWEYRVVSLTE